MSAPADPTTIAEIALDRLDSRAVRDGLAYWQGLTAGRCYPTRQEVSPGAMRAFLRQVCLIQVLGADFEYRFVGDAHAEAYGFHIKGLRLSAMCSMMPGHAERLALIYDAARRRAAPLALRGWAMRSEARFYHESVFLPLGPSAGTVDHILNITDYAPPS